MHACRSRLLDGNRTNSYNEVAPNVLVPFADGSGRIHLRLLNDSVNLHFQFSNDGLYWMDWTCQTTPSNLTNYGFILGTEDGGGNGYGQCTVFQNRLTTLTAAQQNVTSCQQPVGPPVIVGVASVANFKPGDVVSLQGMVYSPGVAPNTNTGNWFFDNTNTWGRGILVTAVDYVNNLLTLACTGGGGVGGATWSSGGVITLLSR
jgi:hypothetical protein